MGRSEMQIVDERWGELYRVGISLQL